MKVNILLFGIAKEIIGDSTYKIELGNKATVKDLRKNLLAKYPDLDKLRSIMIAVNNEYSSDDQLLSSKDEVALIPPVSGG